jgi:hypothetical protein
MTSAHLGVIHWSVSAVTPPGFATDRGRGQEPGAIKGIYCVAVPITSSWIHEARVCKYLQSETCIELTSDLKSTPRTDIAIGHMLKCNHTQLLVMDKTAVPKRCPLGCIYTRTIRGFLALSRSCCFSAACTECQGVLQCSASGVTATGSPLWLLVAHAGYHVVVCPSGQPRNS